MAGQTNILILDDDEQITEALAMVLEADDRLIITCNDLESAQLIVENFPLSLIVSDVQINGAFGFEGLDFIADISAHHPESRIVLMTGAGSAGLREEAHRRGAFAFLEKPFDVASLESFIQASGDVQ